MDCVALPRDIPVSVLLLTTARDELNAVTVFLQPLQLGSSSAVFRVQGERDVFLVGCFGAYAVAVLQSAQASSGVDGSAQAVSRALRDWPQLKAVFAIGFAYGLRPDKLKYGDVLVSERLACFSHRRVTASSTGLPTEIVRGPTPNPGAHLKPLFMDNAVGDWSFACNDGQSAKVSLGLVLSGVELVDSPARARELLALFPEALGGEMEGEGLYSSSFGSVEWILVKSICDFAGLDGKKSKEHQRNAAAAAASLVHHVLSRRTALRSLGVQPAVVGTAAESLVFRWTTSYDNRISLLLQHVHAIKAHLRDTNVIPAAKLAEWPDTIEGARRLHDYANDRAAAEPGGPVVRELCAALQMQGLGFLVSTSAEPAAFQESAVTPKRPATTDATQMPAKRHRSSEPPQLLEQESVQRPICAEPVELIRLVDSKMSLTDPGVTLLSSLAKEQLIVVTIVGRYRVGKSTLLNRLMHQKHGFRQSNTDSSCTKGVWAWGEHLPGNRVLLYLDTEGLFDPEKIGLNDGTSLFVLSLLLSSVLIIHSRGPITSLDLQQLAEVSDLASNIQVGDDSDGDAVKHRLPIHLPDLLWVMGDFDLAHEPGVDDNAYLERQLQPKDNSGDAVRLSLREYFHTRSALCLDRPVLDVSKLSEITDDQLPESYRRKVEGLLARLRDHTRPKTVCSSTDGTLLQVDGPGLVTLLQSYLVRVNGHQRFDVQTAYFELADALSQRACDDALRLYESKLAANSLPLDEAVLLENVGQASAEAIVLFESAVRGRSRSDCEQRLRAAMASLLDKLFMANKNASRSRCEGVLDPMIQQLHTLHGRLSVEPGADAIVAITNQDQLLKAFDTLEELYQHSAIGPAREEVWQERLSQLDKIKEKAASKFELDKLAQEAQVQRAEDARTRQLLDLKERENQALRARLQEDAIQHEARLARQKQNAAASERYWRQQTEELRRTLADPQRNLQLAFLAQDQTRHQQIAQQWIAQEDQALTLARRALSNNRAKPIPNRNVRGISRCWGYRTDGGRCLAFKRDGRCQFHEDQ